MRGLDEYYKAKYFSKDGSAWEIDPKIRDRVQFMRFSLQENYQMFGAFDVIFCRYVLIYFSDGLKRETIAKMSGSLNAGGALFTGNYALYDLFSDDFISEHYENLTYYTKKGGDKIK
jgi:chemotaxis protein methyltransferase CheR